MPIAPGLRIEVMIKDRLVKTYSFHQDVVVVGRDPSADIFLDNTGVSRSHVGFEWTGGGYVVKDLGSTNGTYVADRRISEQPLDTGTLINLSKFTLRVTIEGATQIQVPPVGISAEAFEGTTVLSTEQLARMKAQAQEKPAAQPALQVVDSAKAPEATPPAEAGRPLRDYWLWGVVILLLGLTIGVVLSNLR